MLSPRRQSEFSPSSPAPKQTFGAAPSLAVERVVRQLLEALLFEGCLDSVAVPNPVCAGHTFYFSLDRRHFSCHGRVRGFGRVSLDMQSLVELTAGARQRTALMEVLHWALAAAPGDTAAKSRLLSEMLQTVYWLQWNLQNLPRIVSRRELDERQLETCVGEGHPYHPCFKARSGFTESDHTRYSPECGRPFRLRWLAVPRQSARWTFTGKNSCEDFSATDTESFIETPTGIFTDIAPADFYRRYGDAELFNRCCERDLNPAHYVFVPVHPWQWQNCLQAKLATLSPPTSLIDLGEFGDFYLATQSTRTLMNVTRAGAAHIKLPLDIVCTSSRRNLASHSICVAPAISAWLAECVASDDFYREHPLVILREFAGVLVEASVYAPDSDSATSYFSALWREDIANYLRTDEQAAPMTAMLVMEADGKPFIDRWVQQYGLEVWLQQLLQVVVLPVWHLLARHGIAVEAHAQNSVLIHHNGWPARLALRDFHESVEYVPEFVAAPDKIPDFPGADAYFRAAPANRFYWMDSIDALRELYMDTLYIFHLSELANLCEQHYALAEDHFWQMVARLLADYTSDGWCPVSRVQQLNCTASKVRAESLLRKKLWDVPVDEYHHQVTNPLAMGFGDRDNI